MDVRQLQEKITQRLHALELEMVHVRSQPASDERNNKLEQLEFEHYQYRTAWNINNTLE